MLSNAELESLLEENESLRDEVRQLRGQSPRGSVKENALCRGCHRLRLVLAGLIGIVAATGGWSLVAALNSDAAMLWKVAVVITAAVLPLVTVGFNWKWRLYKNGYPGVLRGIAECCRAFREGRGRK